MPAITLPVHRGTATGIDASLLEPGLLQEAEGVDYMPGDPAARKLGGRSSFAVVQALFAVNGLRFIDFDSASDLLIAQSNGALYSSTISGASFSSIRSGLTATALHLDGTKFEDDFYCCNGLDTNWVVLNSNTTIRHGLTAITTAPTFTSAGTGITGTFIYWATEYDQTNDVESAFTGTGLTVTVTDDTVTITKPATVNASATHWRLYRSKDTGAYPIGWRVATVAIGTTTFADATTDAALVLLAAYPIVTLNGLSESMNAAPPVLRSIASFQGSLTGVASRSLYWSETNEPHSFPASFVMPFRPRFGGQARCVRRLGSVLMVLFDNEFFRVNYLPKAADSFFDAGVAQEWIGNFGTPSPNGAVAFSGWGGQPLLFYASRSGPMLTDGEATDRAVGAIDWSGTVSLANLDRCVAIDNPDRYRVELFYPTSDTTVWRVLHFYYDVDRISRRGGFPELVWTGPHRTPGPGTYATVDGESRVYSGSRTTSGTVYREYSGTSDAANLVDSSGTVNFRARTPKLYPSPHGIGGEARCTRIFVHKASAGSGSFTTTLTAHREEDGSVAESHDISATAAGSSSYAFNSGGKGFDVRIVRDDTAAMPPINNVTLELPDVADRFHKTTVHTS